MCKTFPRVYNSAKIIKIHQDFPELWSQMFCHLFLWFTVYIYQLQWHCERTTFTAASTALAVQLKPVFRLCLPLVELVLCPLVLQLKVTFFCLDTLTQQHFVSGRMCYSTAQLNEHCKFNTGTVEANIEFSMLTGFLFKFFVTLLFGSMRYIILAIYLSV